MTTLCLVSYLVAVVCHYLCFVTLFTLALLWALADIPFMVGMILISR